MSSHKGSISLCLALFSFKIHQGLSYISLACLFQLKLFNTILLANFILELNWYMHLTKLPFKTLIEFTTPIIYRY